MAMTRLTVPANALMEVDPGLETQLRFPEEGRPLLVSVRLTRVPPPRRRSPGLAIALVAASLGTCVGALIGFNAATSAAQRNIAEARLDARPGVPQEQSAVPPRRAPSSVVEPGSAMPPTTRPPAPVVRPDGGAGSAGRDPFRLTQ